MQLRAKQGHAAASATGGPPWLKSLTPQVMQLSFWDNRSLSGGSCLLSSELSQGRGEGLSGPWGTVSSSCALGTPQTALTTVGGCRAVPASSFLSVPSSTAVFAFTWHPALSRVWGETSSWQGESVLAVSPLLPPPCSPPHCRLCHKNVDPV